jgi:endonuclease/exonuclease/phosphatase family metal-dependent hydrolase
VARWLEASDVGVACLQEVVFGRRVDLLRRGAPGFPHAAHDRLAFGVRGGLVTLSRWPVVAQRSQVFHQLGRWWNAGFSDRLLRKGFLVTELDVLGRRLVVVNTHLAANYGGDWTRENDYAALEDAELRQLAEALAGIDEALPVVLAGDLNVPSGTWLFAEFLERTGLRDAFGGAGLPTWRPAREWGRPFDIDHVLVRGPVEVSAELRFAEPVTLPGGRVVPVSDHLGIEASLRLC